MAALPRLALREPIFPVAVTLLNVKSNVLSSMYGANLIIDIVVSLSSIYYVRNVITPLSIDSPFDPNVILADEKGLYKNALFPPLNDTLPNV